MAKIVIEIEDALGGELTLKFSGEDLRTAVTARTNTAAQNAAIYVADQLRAVGIKAPDLSGH
jgi:hypothetical protein